MCIFLATYTLTGNSREYVITLNLCILFQDWTHTVMYLSNLTITTVLIKILEVQSMIPSSSQLIDIRILLTLVIFQYNA